MTQSEVLKEFTSWLQEKGFIWGPEPEIYGGVSGTYTYGPMGKLLKNKIENSVRRIFTSNGFWEIEGPTVLPDIVWQASGHLDTFKDTIVTCSKCNAIYRADKIIEETDGVIASSLSDDEMLEFITQKKINCPKCKSAFNQKIERKSLMMKTKIGNQDAALRPETATVTYLPFKRCYTFFRKKLPIGVFQIGKAYRNEISPRQHVIRGREFTQAEGQLFVDPDQKKIWEKYKSISKEKLPLWPWNDQEKHKQVKSIKITDAIKKKYLQGETYAWCIWLAYSQFRGMGIPEDCIRIREHHPDERIFYAAEAWDIEVKLNTYGWIEMCGIHDRTDYDLKQHEKFSKIALDAMREDGTKIKPHVLEIAFGTDRPTLAVLDIFYEKKEKDEGKTIFRVPYHIAPVDVVILPLVKKEELTDTAKRIRKQLEKEFIVDYDETGSIGRRYLRAAAVGTPYALTVDYEGITLRDRDTEKQVRIKEDGINETLRNLFDGNITLKSLGKEL